MIGVQQSAKVLPMDIEMNIEMDPNRSVDGASSTEPEVRPIKKVGGSRRGAGRHSHWGLARGEKVALKTMRVPETIGSDVLRFARLLYFDRVSALKELAALEERVEKRREF
jgi:hypothetical protein